mgnify:CR=1 FL=1
MLLDTSENEAKGMFHNIFDTDRNGLVDALEVLASMAMLSCMPIKDKIDFVYSLYDFNSSGDITIDEMTIMLRTVASGTGKLDKTIKAPEVKEIERRLGGSGARIRRGGLSRGEGSAEGHR